MMSLPLHRRTKADLTASDEAVWANKSGKNNVPRLEDFTFLFISL
jgi:hypothetical protein